MRAAPGGEKGISEVNDMVQGRGLCGVISLAQAQDSYREKGAGGWTGSGV